MESIPFHSIIDRSMKVEALYGGYTNQCTPEHHNTSTKIK